MADNQRRRRYLTISILHIITIMCQGNISLSFFFYHRFNSGEFFLSPFSRKVYEKNNVYSEGGRSIQSRQPFNLPFFFTMNCIRTV